MCVCVCVCARARACMLACVCACGRVCAIVQIFRIKTTPQPFIMTIMLQQGVWSRLGEKMEVNALGQIQCTAFNGRDIATTG